MLDKILYKCSCGFQWYIVHSASLVKSCIFFFQWCQWNSFMLLKYEVHVYQCTWNRASLPNILPILAVSSVLRRRIILMPSSGGGLILNFLASLIYMQRTGIKLSLRQYTCTYVLNLFKNMIKNEYVTVSQKTKIILT